LVGVVFGGALIRVGRRAARRLSAPRCASASSSVRLAASLSLILCATASAQTWTGAVSGNWNTGANWSSNPNPPSSGNNTQLIFGGTGNAAMTDDIPGTFILNKLTFNSGAPVYTLTGNLLEFRRTTLLIEPSIVMNSANNVSIA